MVGRRHVSTPATAAHRPSSWHRFGGSSLPEHRFKVWRHDQRGPVFVCGRCMRRWTDRHDAKLHHWTQSHASWCAGCVVGNIHGRNPVFSSRLVWGSMGSRSHRVVRLTRMWTICRASWEYWAWSDSRYSRVTKNAREGQSEPLLTSLTFVTLRSVAEDIWGQKWPDILYTSHCFSYYHCISCLLHWCETVIIVSNMLPNWNAVTLILSRFVLQVQHSEELP